jgi:hypothetical protein
MNQKNKAPIGCEPKNQSAPASQTIIQTRLLDAYLIKFWPKTSTTTSLLQ